MNGLIGGGDYPYEQAQAGSLANAKMVSVPTLRQRLDMAVQQAEERLTAVKEARELFDRNPDMEKLLNIMQKAHF